LKGHLNENLVLDSNDIIHQGHHDIKRVLFIYLTQESGEYYVTDDPGYEIQRRPQLGLQYLCAVLGKRNIETGILDQAVINFNIKQLVATLKDWDAVGFYASDPQEAKVKAYCKQIKARSPIPILVGGPSTLGNPSFLDHGCDIVVHGEGERTILEIVDFLEGKTSIDLVKGISYKQADRIITNEPQGLIENLDEIPFPDRSKVDIIAYQDYFIFGMRKPYITMIASRGCIYRCHFCTSCKIWGYRYRQRSVDNVLAEIDAAVHAYNVKYIAFQDDVFGITNPWIEEFCTKLMKRQYRIRWMVILHPFSIGQDQERILRLMKRAGCDTLSFGLQSADAATLRGINRSPAEPARLKSILATAKRLGLVTVVGYIFGLPGDTRKSIQKTLDYALHCGATLSNFYVLSILRGSEMERMYGTGNVSNLPRDEIVKLTKQASKTFYTYPETIWNILLFILKNPGWLFYVVLRFRAVLSRIGF